MGDVLKPDPERATVPLNYNGHTFKRSFGALRCSQCKAEILDRDIFDAPGAVQEAIDALLSALGPCDQVNAVRGRVAGTWRVKV